MVYLCLPIKNGDLNIDFHHQSAPALPNPATEGQHGAIRWFLQGSDRRRAGAQHQHRGP